MDIPAEIFSRQRRRARRSVRRGDDFFGATIAEGLLDRLSVVTRPISKILILGGRSEALVDALRLRPATVDVAEAAGGAGLTGEPDALDVEPGSYDAILWPGGLESVNDVPGALLRARFALRPDGLLLGALIGDGSFPHLRRALQNGTAMARRPAAARLHPQISVQAMGDLLQRAGFALPVIDADTLSLRYRSLAGVVRDLRANALTSMLAGPVPPLGRSEWAAAEASFVADGPTVETVRIIHFFGWAPDASQPQPARRGSATASLAAALRAQK
jgi:SAM-dependent methyltransferase